MRELPSRAISHAYQAGKYGQKGHHDDVVFEAFAREQANFQTKYALFGDDWRVKALRVADDAFDATLLPSALATLSYYDLVGRTEEMQAFRDAIDARMGWPLLDATVKHTSNSWAISGGGGRLPPTARALEDARRYNAIDAQLYRSFCRRNGTRNGNGGHHRRVVQPLWAAPPYQFPHYWTDVSHNDSKVKYTCAQNVGLCKWTLLPAHDSRACRAGSAETSPPEAAPATPRAWRAAHSSRTSATRGPNTGRRMRKEADHAGGGGVLATPWERVCSTPRMTCLL